MQAPTAVRLAGFDAAAGSTASLGGLAPAAGLAARAVSSGGGTDRKPFADPFMDKETERIFQRNPSRRFSSDIQRKARIKLEILDAAEGLQDLRVPPSNRLEKFSGDRQGQHSIRINDQWRICFVWQDGDAFQVEIVDYH